MTNQIMEKERQLDQLGLPPMELAETSNDQNTSCIYRCMYPALQKLFILLSLVTFSIGAYILLIKLIESTDKNTHSTEIIVLTGLRDTPNITLHQNDMDIFFQLRNYSDTNIRRKRSVIKNPLDRDKNIFDHLRSEDLDKVKGIIMQHHALCHEQSHVQTCSDLMHKLRAIINRKEIVSHEKVASIESNEVNNKIMSMPAKQEIRSRSKKRISRNPNLADTCLLAKLLKQSYPQAQEIYAPVHPERLAPIFDTPQSPHMRYFQPPVPLHMQTFETSMGRQKQHPQDLNILMDFFQSGPKPNKHKSSQLECPLKSAVCDNNEECVEEKKWCDGRVDCSDSSDEIRCSCKSRVDKSRLCDGYFDCPFGEDEMGCFGCSENTFSCASVGLITANTCFTKEQRCNGVADCFNNKDESDCNMLTPSLNVKPLFAISNTEGYLHRNFRGDWYAACDNPYMWAHEACLRETGLMMRPPFIQLFKIDPRHQIKYLNTGPGSFVQITDTCHDNSAVYVTCPSFLCGTRVSTSSQMLLHENVAAENQIFGRDKRFLAPSFSSKRFNPYHWFYNGNRMKRDIEGINNINRKTTMLSNEDHISENSEVQARVVGGKPSKPASWPWMVAIYRDGSFLCGGVILTQSWVVSAAHCVHRFWEHYYEVQVGILRRLSFSPQEQTHRVSHVIVNHHYDESDMSGDLSLLRVEPDILFSRWVRPICLPGHETNGRNWTSLPAPNTVCTAVGWGATVEHGPDPDHLREVEVPIWETCKHREDKAGNEICAGLVEGGKDACQGDSGGPLLCRNPRDDQQWYLAGIVSHGDGCARKNEPGVYTRVSLYVKWIKYHISSSSLPQVQPKQICPGFKCKFGISKCLPLSSRCDKIVDCLDAQDEINCNFIKLRNNPSNNSIGDISEKPSRHVKSTLILSKQATTSTYKNENIPEDILTSTDKIISTTTNSITNVHDDMEQSSITISSLSTVNENPDFQHASTIETSPTDSVEALGNITDESVTSEPITVTVTNEDSSLTNSVEMNTMTMSLDPVALESRSSVLEKRENSSEITEGVNNLVTTLFPQTNEQNFRTTTQQNRGDIVNEFENEFQSNTGTEPTVSNTQSLNILEDGSNALIIELLPNISSTTSQPDSLINTEASVDGNKINSSDANTESQSPKNLPEIEDSKSDLIHKIENMVFSELQPANIRRKHLVPKEYECQRIFQMISYSQHCDRKVDCEDGTDELDCTCTDYLSTYDEKLICDGVFDYADGQDETECFSCPEDHFLCHKSELCLPLKYVCDGNPQCPRGEDELSCFALTNGREIIYGIDGKPKTNIEGFLTKRYKNDWQVVCEETLTIDQQEQSASSVCHYLGFSSFNKYLVKHLNIKEEDIRGPPSNEFDSMQRMKRGTDERFPVHFAYRDKRNSNATERNLVIKEPQLLKEECVPNVTKTCKSLYVYCDPSLFTNFAVSQDLLFNKASETHNEVTSHMWPWIAKIFIEGEYKCTGVLIDLTWVLASDSCLWDSSPTKNFISVILGSHRTLDSTNGFYEQIRQVDAKKELHRSRVVLLHLKKSALYSNMVKPMKISFSSSYSENDAVCVAIGQDNDNNTISVFVNETRINCNLSNRCFVRQGKENICPNGVETHRPWSGLISCHNEHGWYPSLSFVESRGECGLGERIDGTDIESLIHEIKYYSGKELISDTNEQFDDDNCEGIRCSRGRCVHLHEMCDGVKSCADGNDESENACKIKKLICEEDPYHKGCECAQGEMKCKNGKCISKELFKNGKDDCGDQTDEPSRSTCSDYLARVMPSRLCDGVVHCEDRSDEDPLFCKCFSKTIFRCDRSGKGEHCVAPDMVCDGVRDCPNGEDERTCIALISPDGTAHGTGQVIVCSHGVWHSKCYPTQNHTKLELEAICRELGFISGHAKEIKDKKYLVNTHNKLLLEPFGNVVLNDQTSIKMRNTDGSIAVPVYDEDLKDCYPVFIECL